MLKQTKEKLTLIPYQVKGVEFLTRNRHTLLGDDMGLGKTIQVVAAINQLKANRVLIICPASVKYNWEKEMQRFLQRDLSIQIINKRKDVIDTSINIHIINYELIQYHYPTLKQIKYAVGVCDESQKLKGNDTIRTKKILHKDGVLHNCYFKILLTGTPIQNNPIDLYPTIAALRPDLIQKHASFTAFGRYYCGAYFNGFRMIYSRPSGKKAAELKQILGQFMLRRKQEDVLKDLPKLTLQHIPIPMDAKLRRIKKEEDQLVADIGRKESQFGQDAVSEYARLAITNGTWQKTAAAKLPFCIEHVEDILESVEKIVIFAYHRQIISDMSSALGKHGVVVLTGQTTAIKRKEVVDTFVTDPKTRVFIGQIEAAGTGIDGLQRVCHTSIFVQISYVPGHIKQAVKRLSRIGQTKPVQAQFLLVENSVEKAMFDAVILKNDLINKIVG